LERTGFLSSGRIFSNAIPVLLALTGVILSNVPISFTGNHVPAPLLGLMPVYFWCLVRPDLMSPMWALLIGLLEDVLAPGPPGLWAAAYIATYTVVSRQRDVFAGLSGFVAVLGFATAAFVACGSAYLIKCVLDWRLLPIGSIAGEMLSSAILYMPVVAILNQVHRRFVGPLRSEL
jgi:rod shape-determining protein MreD